MQNLLLFIEDPAGRAYYLPGIDLEYEPFPATEDPPESQLVAKHVHEMAHRALSTANAFVCELRFTEARLLASIVHFLTLEDNNRRLLVPSFKITSGNKQESQIIAALAARFDELLDAGRIIHEIFACAEEGEFQGWDSTKIMEVTIEHLGEQNAALVGDKWLEEFLQVYERIGCVSCSICKYALDEVGSTKQKALVRFRRAIRATRGFTTAAAGPADNPATDIIENREQEFVQHLRRTLPDFNNRCRYVQRGACVVDRLDRLERSYPRPTYPIQALRANYIPQLFSRVLTYNRDNHGGAPLFQLSKGGFKMQVPEGHSDEWLFWIEAIFEQLWWGKGPGCVFISSEDVDRCQIHHLCLYKPVLELLWERTDPDPEWPSNWKDARDKPKCV